ncbi:MAG TPA: hypothetical protein VI248_20885 [Kineosporiaceae bacterium]
MLYQFEAPFEVDSTKIADPLGLRATPVEEALEITMTAYRR